MLSHASLYCLTFFTFRVNWISIKITLATEMSSSLSFIIKKESLRFFFPLLYTGGLICRGVLSVLPHNVETFIALSCPLAGQYGGELYWHQLKTWKWLITPLQHLKNGLIGFCGHRIEELLNAPLLTFGDWWHFEIIILCLSFRYWLPEVFLPPTIKARPLQVSTFIFFWVGGNMVSVQLFYKSDLYPLQSGIFCH